MICVQMKIIFFSLIASVEKNNYVYIDYFYLYLKLVAFFLFGIVLYTFLSFCYLHLS